ncbi:MAG TPA: hypothetical protein VGN24_09780 [Rhodanobacter sp.]|jgi:hypothetical protein|nr:hypothetical protein [Rhodanobacter sp.]
MVKKSFFSGFVMLMLLSGVAAGTSMPISASTRSSVVTASGGSGDFDFLYGTWIVHNRRLANRLAGSTTWISFDARDAFTPLAGGIGTQEHYQTDYWKNYEAVGMQIYDPQSRRWTLYWVDNHNLPIAFQPPISGTFHGDIGTFEGQDTFNGKPIIVRAIWRKIDKNNVTWEQAFSTDRGRTWETNWTMDFIRQ